MNAYENLELPKNADPGVADYFLFAPVSAFTTIAAFNPAAPSSSGSDAVISDNHVFKANEGFVKIMTAQGKNQISISSGGEVANLKHANKFEAYTAGSYKELHQFLKNYKNVPCILLVRDSSNDEVRWYQLGDDKVFAFLESFEGGTGTNTGGTKGYKLTYHAPNDTLYQYTGNIDYKP